MGLLDKISKLFEEISEEKRKRYWERQDQKRIEEEKTKELNKLKSAYYDAWIHNFILDCKEEFSYYDHESGEYDDYKFRSEYKKVYESISNEKVIVPECPEDAFIMEKVWEHACDKDEGYYHEEYDSYWGTYSKERDKYCNYYNAKHVFIELILHNSEYKEIARLISTENYDALYEIRNVLSLQLLYEEKFMNSD